jgi:hypothetical protein
VHLQGTLDDNGSKLLLNARFESASTTLKAAAERTLSPFSIKQMPCC